MKQKRLTPLEMKYINDNYVDTSGEINIIKDEQNINIVKVEAKDIPAGVYRFDFGTIELANYNRATLNALNIETSQIRSVLGFEVCNNEQNLTFTIKSRGANSFKQDLRIQEMFNNLVKKQDNLSF